MSTILIVSVLLIINIAFGGTGYSTKDTLIKTTEGYVQGIKRDGITQFIGIPFAKPPVGNLRFEPPEPLDKRPKRDVLDATQTLDSVNICPQILPIGSNRTEGDEDCLYLSIFIPDKKKKKLPVMIWYAGGAFENGAGSLLIYDPTTWLNNPKANNVIIVTINYRLGALGWLYDNAFGTGIAGNFGYLDVLQATEWVYKNIKKFGGDKKNIITFGQSAGAYLAMMQLLYDNDKGHVAGSILQSPNIQVPSRDPDTWYNVFQTFAGSVGCVNPATIATCLKQVPMQVILAAQAATVDIPGIGPRSIYGAPANEWYYPVIWGPTALTSTMPNQLLYEFQDNGATTAPFIIGTVRDEQYFTFSQALAGGNLDFNTFVGLLANLVDQINIFVSNPVVTPTTAPSTFSILGYYGILPTATSVTGDFYTDFLEILNDNWYCAVRNILKSLGDDTDDTYYYNFDYINLQTNAVFQQVSGFTGCADKVCHGVDLFYEFMIASLQPLYDADTILMGEDVIQPLFTKFAHGRSKKLQKIWPEYTNDDTSNVDNFLRFLGPNNLVKESTFTSESRANTNPISARNGLCDFWDSQGYLYGSARAIAAKDAGIDDEGVIELYESHIYGLEKITSNEDKHMDNYVEIGIGLLAVFAILMIGIGVYKCCVNNKGGKYQYSSSSTEKDPLLVSIQTKY